MASSFTSVPVVDVSPLLKDLNAGRKSLSVDALQVCSDLHRACQDVGFFYVSNHGVSKQLQDELAAAAKVFFSLDEVTKARFSMAKGGRAWRGWFQLGDELTSGRADQKEGYYFGTELGADDARVVAKTPMHGANLFPDDVVPQLRRVVLSYMNECKLLAQSLLKGLAVGLMGEEQSDYFARRFTDDPTELFRIFRYPEHTFADEADEWGVREHTDYGFLTILLQDDSGGLEVRSWDGSWVVARPVADTFVVNIGDCLEKWTAGRYRATPHRVRNVAKHDRFSFPYFFDPNFGASLLPIEDELLSRHRKLANRDRWDKTDVELIQGISYGEYVLSKVLKVFPQLGDATAVSKQGASWY